MKTKLRLGLVALMVAAMTLVASFGAAAQTNPNAPTLTFSGNVQICSSAAAGATCRPAIQGEEVPPGTHVMVGQDASAQLRYPNEAIVNFTQPGLYTVNAAPANFRGTRSAGSVIASNAAFITFAALIAAAGVAASVLDDDEDLLVPLSE